MLTPKLVGRVRGSIKDIIFSKKTKKKFQKTPLFISTKGQENSGPLAQRGEIRKRLLFLGAQNISNRAL